MPDSRDDDDSWLRAIARAPDRAMPGQATDSRVGATVRDKYTLDRVLGEGGMAIVYEATHRNRKRFAIKMLKIDAPLAKSAQSRFVREGYVANSVGHPGAVSILDDDVTEDGAAFIVMELLDGAPLDRVLRTGPAPALPVRAVLSVGVQVLDVLAAAHAKGIVHRDIKPQNLFVTREGAVKVLDFGVARLRDKLSRVDTTESGVMMGTPAFMPPEQALGKNDEISAETDIWAVGATLFFMLSGLFVHEGATGQELVVRSATTPARSLATVAPRVPKGLVAIVDRALAFEKSARWSSASEMRDALRELHVALHDEKVSNEPLVAVFDSAGMVVGADAMADTSFVPAGSRARRLPRWTVAFVLGASAAAIFVALRPRGEDAAAVSVMLAPSTASLGSAVTSTALGAPTQSAPASPDPGGAAAPRSTAAPIDAVAKVGAQSSAAPGQRPAPARDVASRPSSSAPACDPPYTVDAVGKRVPKPACL